MAGRPRTILLHTCVITCVISVTGFNLDTTIPIIKEGPDNSHFGFSVAQHQQVRRIGLDSFSNEVLGNFLIVGAPNLNIPSSNENHTGGVYKCNALSPRRDDCELLLQNEYSPQAKKDEGRHNQWLGVTVRSGGAGKGVVACAHRYRELKPSGNSVNIYGLGACYQLTQELAFDQDMGVGNVINPCKGYSKAREHEEYAFCQAGTGAFVTEDERLVMGAPGAINWRGMLTEVDVSPSFGIKRIYRTPTTDADPVDPPVPLISYLGYSVVGGKFDNTDHTYFVAGAPRSRGYGQVVFFTEMASGNLLSYEMSQILTADQSFSGYGQDLIAVDINNDGYKDLVVGCPFYYSQEKDNIRVGGAVYVYTGNGDMITEFTKPQIIVGRSLDQQECDKLQCLHARFGFSLAAAGDLNKDDYGDFAVGAPYEGRGAVYIYHGSATGVKEPFSQRIYAEDLNTATAWNTFGYSLSGSMDLDQNSYPDLLVGSYIDNKVALLRTRPIINLYSKVDVTPDKLNMSSNTQRVCEDINPGSSRKRYCVAVKLCLRFTAEPVDRFDGNVNIIYTITAEPDRLNPRIKFKVNGGLSQTVESSFQLLKQKDTGLPDAENPKFACVSETAYLEDQITDVLSAIEFGISYKLPERIGPISTPSPGALPDINEYPILDAGLTDAETMLITRVEFIKKCGEDQICKSDLQMEVRPGNLKLNKDKDYVLEIGTVDKLQIHVGIENHGEIAYQTAFYITKPDYLTWQQSEPKDIGCIPVNETMIECKDIGSKEMGKPLKAGEVTQFLLFFQVDPVTISTVRTLELTAWINTTSEETTPRGDHVKIPIVVFVNADLIVIGQSEPDSAIPYSGEVRGESAMHNERMIGRSVNHTFSVYNIGPGVVETSEITIYWPYEMQSKYAHGKYLLYIMHPPEVLAGGGDATCFDQPEIVNVVNIAEYNAFDRPPRPFTVTTATQNLGPEYTVQDGRRRRRETDTSNSKPEEIRADKPKIGESREKKSVVVLDCDRNTAKCYEIRCKIGILNKDQSVRIRIRSRLWESTLLEEFREVDEVRIRSKAKIHIRPELNVVQIDTENDIGYATTIAIPSITIVQEKALEWWIYALAVLGGLVLLVLLALCLWKCGFFKRKRYDEMTTYNVKVEKKKDIHNPTYDTKVEKQKEYLDESEYFLKH